MNKYISTKKIGESERVYECKENDNVIKIQYVDGKIDEVWFSDCIQKSWLILGAKDLKEAGVCK